MNITKTILFVSLIALFVFTISTSVSYAVPGEKTHVFLMAGQSNMDGHASNIRLANIINMTNTLPQSEWESNIQTHIENDYCNWRPVYCNAENFDFFQVLAGNVTKYLINGTVSAGMQTERNDVLIDHVFKKNYPVAGLEEGYGAKKKHFGPELHFGTILGNEIDDPIMLLKYANGGSSIRDKWCSPSMTFCETGPNIGVNYDKMINHTNNYLSSFDPNQVEVTFVWFQGWNDGKYCPNYETNFPNLISDIRNDLGIPDLTFIVAESHRHCTGNSQYNLVGDIQRAVVESDGNAFSFPTSDLARYYHYNPESHLVIGERMATIYLENVYSPLP